LAYFQLVGVENFGNLVRVGTANYYNKERYKIVAVNCGPIHRGEINMSKMTIQEMALLQLYAALLPAKSYTPANLLKKAKKATELYLQEIEPNTDTHLSGTGGD
jgi:hypothetical protein